MRKFKTTNCNGPILLGTTRQRLNFQFQGRQLITDFLGTHSVPVPVDHAVNDKTLKVPTVVFQPYLLFPNGIQLFALLGVRKSGSRLENVDEPLPYLLVINAHALEHCENLAIQFFFREAPFPSMAVDSAKLGATVVPIAFLIGLTPILDDLFTGQTSATMPAGDESPGVDQVMGLPLSSSQPFLRSVERTSVD